MMGLQCTTQSTEQAVAQAAAQTAEQSATQCATRYPLLLVHGISLFTRQRPGKYWGRIPQTLEAHGANVHLVYVDGWGSVKTNAQLIKQQLLEVLEKDDSKQVNIIAHSKGGLDARYCLGALDCQKYVASLTTLASPNNGSKSIDWLMRYFGFVVKLIAHPLNWLMLRLGDGSSDFYGGCQQLTTAAMRQFNQQYPVPQAVYCQSYAAAMKRVSDDIAMWFSYLAIRIIEGSSTASGQNMDSGKRGTEITQNRDSDRHKLGWKLEFKPEFKLRHNDGLVTPEGAAFGSFMGVLQASPKRGISHREMIDGRQKALVKPQNQSFCAKTPEVINDIVDWYVQLVADLKQRGF